MHTSEVRGWTTDEYREAAGGRRGDYLLVGWWLDKPHQVVSALTYAIEERDARIEQLERELEYRKNVTP